MREERVRELDRCRFCPSGSPYEEMAKTAWLHPGPNNKLSRNITHSVPKSMILEFICL